MMKKGSSFFIGHPFYGIDVKITKIHSKVGPILHISGEYKGQELETYVDTEPYMYSPMWHTWMNKDHYAICG